jgi:hypothetical protein
MNAHMYGMTPSGAWVPMLVEGQGGGFGGAGAPSASPLANGWSYAAASGGIENTSDVAIKAAAGAGRYNYLTAVQLMNADDTVGTEVVVKDGSTVIFRTHLAPLAASTAPVPVHIPFNPPLVGSNNTALNVACITTSAKVYANAQGYVGGAPNQAAITESLGIEMMTDNDDFITDDSDVVLLA